MKQILFLLIIAISSIQISIAQRVLYNVDGSILKDITTLSVGDSVLFMFDKTSADGKVSYAKWITDSTTVAASPFDHLFSAVDYCGETYLYSLTGSRKEIHIKAVVIDKNRNQHKADSSLTITGNIVGTFEDGKSLYIVTLASNAQDLSIMEIKKLKIVNQSTYKLPTTITIDGSNPMECFIESSQLNAFKGRANVKLYKYSDRIFLTIDKPMTGMTWVVSIDQITKNMSTRTMRSEAIDVGTFLLDSVIFRESIDKNKITVTVYDKTSLQPVASKDLLSTDPGFLLYFRYGSKYITRRQTSVIMFKVLNQSEVVLNVIKQNGKYVIQTGTYHDSHMSAAIISPFTVAGMISTIVANVMYVVTDGPGITRYFHYTYDPAENTILMKDDSLQLTKEKVDNYEIEQGKKRIHYKFRDYRDHKNGIIGTYYNANQKLATIVYFE